MEESERLLVDKRKRLCSGCIYTLQEAYSKEHWASGSLYSKYLDCTTARSLMRHYHPGSFVHAQNFDGAVFGE